MPLSRYLNARTLPIDKKQLKRFQDRRPQYAGRTLELLGFTGADDAPMYCIPVLNDVEIPLTIASFVAERDFDPAIDFVIHIDEYDSKIPAGRYAKFLSSYLLDNEEFNRISRLWRALISNRSKELAQQTDPRFTEEQHRQSIADASEFYVSCLVWHKQTIENELEFLRPMWADTGILESDLDLEP